MVIFFKVLSEQWGTALRQNRLQRDILSFHIMLIKQLYFFRLEVKFWFFWRRLWFSPLQRLKLFLCLFHPLGFLLLLTGVVAVFPGLQRCRWQSQSFCYSPSRDSLSPDSHAGVSISCGWESKRAACFWGPVSSHCLDMSDEKGDLDVSLPIPGFQTPLLFVVLSPTFEATVPPVPESFWALCNEVTCFIHLLLPFPTP